MKNDLTKKIILGISVCILSFSIAGFTSPSKAHAQLVVSDPGDTVQNTLSAINNQVTAIETTGEQLQNSVLDKIATAIAKQLLMTITQSVISWINSGFNGNPSFIQNPTAFFENVGDQLTGQFISQNGELSSLCSPFSLQIRLALALKQQQKDGSNSSGKYACTLSTIIQNTTNAINSAGVSVSVQGFLSGNFGMGGFPAFTALTTQPQNNPNGAYLSAEDELLAKINAQTAQKQNELSQGQGFLSWETCSPNNSSDDSSDDEDDSGDYSAASVDEMENGPSASTNTSNTTAADSNENYDFGASVGTTPTTDSGGDTPESGSSQPSASNATIDNYAGADGITNSSLTGSAINSVSSSNNTSAADSNENYDFGASVGTTPTTDSAANTSYNSASVDEMENGPGTSANSSAVDEMENGPGAGSSADPYGTAEEDDPNENCSIQTPGSVISATLNKHLAVPTENLELANSINDIINAAFSELIVIALQKGLTSVTQTSNGSSYLQNAINSANQQSFAQSKQQLITTITPYLSTAQTIDQNYNNALGLVLAASSTIGRAELCYQALQASTASAYSTNSSYLGEQVANLENDALTLPTLAQTIISDGGSASTTDYQYQSMYNQVEAAQNLNNLTTPSQTLSNLTQSGELPSQASVQSSKTLLSNTQNTVQPIQAEANTALQECQSFDYNGTNTSGSTGYTNYIQ